MKQRDFTSAKAKEALLKDKEKCCGECCWFCLEDTDGWGQCMLGNVMEGWGTDLDPTFGYITKCDHTCDNCSKYVSIQEMRHHMAVILQGVRNATDPTNRKRPDDLALVRASSFAYRYMKVFSKL